MEQERPSWLGGNLAPDMTGIEERLRRAAAEMKDAKNAALASLRARVEELEAERDALAAEVERLRAALLSRRFVDCTPDDGLPLRILLAYIDNSSWSDNTLGIEPTSPLCIELNRIQAERNAIINNAIRALQKAEGPC